MRFGCCVNMLVPFGQGTGADEIDITVRRPRATSSSDEPITQGGIV